MKAPTETEKAQHTAAVTYPIVVDEKLLWAMIHCGDAIISNPKADRLAMWEKLRGMLAQQCKDSASIPDPASALPALVGALEPGVLNAIADEIDCFEHSARAHTLRLLAKEAAAALALVAQGGKR